MWKLKFKDNIMEEAIKLELKGNCVITPLFPLNDKYNYTKEEIELLGIIHKQKIEISDAIYVVNVNNYIGESTKSEIEYAKLHNKEIIYMN